MKLPEKNVYYIYFQTIEKKWGHQYTFQNDATRLRCSATYEVYRFNF